MSSKFIFLFITLFISACGHKTAPKYIGTPLPDIIDSQKRKYSQTNKKEQTKEEVQKIEKAK